MTESDDPEPNGSNPNGLGPSDPGLVFSDGTPVSTRFDDVYFSREGGLAETRHVFIEGCGLPSIWHRRGPVFTVGETGFGTGLNFLATWELWRRNRPGGTTLHYLAVEGFPIPRGSLARALAPFADIRDLTGRFLGAYPADVRGLHRIWFVEDQVCLTLAIGQADQVLPSLSARVDAWFLDGFAPSRNPDMWSPTVFAQVARLSSPGARLASFTAAGAVRRGLGAVGFDVVKRQGFGGKRDCIQGRFRQGPVADSGEPWFAPPPTVAPQHVAVVGAGVAGAAMVGALAKRGIRTTWLERHDRAAAEASGNPIGLVMPRPTVGGNAGGSVNPSAFRYAVEEAARTGVPVQGNGVVELATDDKEADRFAALSDTGALAGLSTSLVNSVEASRVAGVSLDRPALWHARAGWLAPARWTEALSAGVPVSPGCRVSGFDPGIAPGDHIVRLVDGDGRCLSEADAVVIAAGAGTQALLGEFALPIEPVRGQIARLQATASSRRLAACLAYGGYLTPTINGDHVAGATYDRQGFDPDAWPVPTREADHRRIAYAMPPGVRKLFANAPQAVAGRAALRAVTPDRQPVAGPLATREALCAAYPGLRTDARRSDGGPAPYRSGWFVLGGLGSRGLVTAPLLAELIAAQMLGEPWPLEADAAAAVHPSRFTIRALKRREI